MTGLPATPTKKSRKLMSKNERELDARWNRQEVRIREKGYVSKKKVPENQHYEGEKIPKAFMK